MSGQAPKISLWNSGISKMHVKQGNSEMILRLSCRTPLRPLQQTYSKPGNDNVFLSSKHRRPMAKLREIALLMEGNIYWNRLFQAVSFLTSLPIFNWRAGLKQRSYETGDDSGRATSYMPWFERGDLYPGRRWRGIIYLETWLSSLNFPPRTLRSSSSPSFLAIR